MDRSSISAPKPPKRNVIRIKIISMGPAASGKSCLIKRYCEEKVSLPPHQRRSPLASARVQACRLANLLHSTSNSIGSLWLSMHQV